jgi:uncharacterized membrane protein YebE (DUF533 family)
MKLTNGFNNIIQGATLRGQIAGAKSDGKVTTTEANALIARAKAGGVQPSELAALRQLALESRNSNKFDAGAKAALNNFLGKSADASYASGRLPPEANLPQNLKIFGSALGNHLDKARLNALDKHFKKDDGRIGEREMGTILKNIFKDGNVSSTERKYLQQKLSDPAVSAEAKKDIRLILSLVPGDRITGDGIGIKFPGFPRPFPLPPIKLPPVIVRPMPNETSAPGPSTGTNPSTGGTPTPGTGGTAPSPSTGGTSPSTGGTDAGGFPKYPAQPTDPKDLSQQNKYQEEMFAYQQAMQQMMQKFNMLTTTSKAAFEGTNKIIGNLPTR